MFADCSAASGFRRVKPTEYKTRLIHITGNRVRVSQAKYLVHIILGAGVCAIASKWLDTINSPTRAS